MKTDDNISLYQAVYKNAEMGVNTTAKLLSHLKDPAIKQHLREEHRQYTSHLQNAQNALYASGKKPRGISSIAKGRTSAMIGWELKRNDATAHIAKMLMTGNHMGIIHGIQALKHCPEADSDATGLMNSLLKAEEENYQNLKQFL